MKTKKLSGLLMIVLSVILMMSTLCLPASAAKSISKATVSVASAIYTGKTLKPKVTVKLSKDVSLDVLYSAIEAQGYTVIK